MTPVLGLVVISGWHGSTCYPVEVFGETPKKLRIRALRTMRLQGRGRSLRAGETALVPRTAVRITGGPKELERARAEADAAFFGGRRP